MTSPSPRRFSLGPSRRPPVWASLAILLLGLSIILAVQWNRESRALLDDWTGEKAAELVAAISTGLESLPEKDWNAFIASLAGRHVPSILIGFGACEKVALSNNQDELNLSLAERIGPALADRLNNVRSGASSGETWTETEGRSFLFPLRGAAKDQPPADEIKGVIRLVIDDRMAQERLLRARFAGGASYLLLAMLLVGAMYGLFGSLSRRTGGTEAPDLLAHGGGLGWNSAERKEVSVLEMGRGRTEELAAKTREFEGVVQSIPDTVLRLKEDGEIAFLKEAAEVDFVKTLGLFSKDDSGKPTSRGQGGQLVKEAVRAGQESRIKCAGSAVAEMEIAGGSVELRVAPLVDGGYLVLARDISARRKLEDDIKQSLKREKELSQMKSQFISVASHEFRTPMSAIAFSADLLQNFSDRIHASKKAELVERILTGVDRLRSIVDDVLVLSRVDAGRVEVTKIPTDLTAFFKDVLEEARVADKRKHIFELKGETGPVRQVLTDAKLLRQIVSSLLSNAMRFSPAGTAIAASVAKEENRFWFRIEDEGIGIPEKDKGHLFEPFFRASNAGEIGGTGLGLSIVKKYTELLGGVVELVPTSRGACFQATFPCESFECNENP